MASLIPVVVEVAADAVSVSSTVIPKYVGADAEGIIYFLGNKSYMKVEEPIATNVPITGTAFQITGQQIHSALGAK